MAQDAEAKFSAWATDFSKRLISAVEKIGEIITLNTLSAMYNTPFKSARSAVHFHDRYQCNAHFRHRIKIKMARKKQTSLMMLIEKF